MNDDKWGLWIMRYTGKEPAAASAKKTATK
jgi:hypothetical protein